MSKTLTAFVSLADEAGTLHRFGPGDQVPDWALNLVTNPDAFSGDEGDPLDVPDEAEHAAQSEPDAEASGPDFTKPAPRRGRPRKNV